ncbi:hypothetical protein [Polaromonas sp. CG9_12]|nr:hypothetical protein [Polaromonas sp. CG9_12]
MQCIECHFHMMNVSTNRRVVKKTSNFSWFSLGFRVVFT